MTFDISKYCAILSMNIVVEYVQEISKISLNLINCYKVEPQTHLIYL